MKKFYQRFVRGVILSCCLSIACVIHAEGSELPPVPIPSQHAFWIFSGLVSNERGENFGYFFKMQRDAAHFQVRAALFDAETQRVLIEEDSQAILENTHELNWHVGHAFLHFNPINDSWVFGFKNDKKQGFNFKVDMLDETKKSLATKVQDGVTQTIRQTKQLNGHIQIGAEGEDQFVTAGKTWFRKITLTDDNMLYHPPFQGLLCQWRDGGGFYTMHTRDIKAQCGAMAGWYNANGKAQAISQFVTIKQDPDNRWHIHALAPPMDLFLTNLLENKNTQEVAGFVVQDQMPGFCVLSEELFINPGSLFAQQEGLLRSVVWPIG